MKPDIFGGVLLPVAGVGGLQYRLPDPCEIPTLQCTASASDTYGIGA